MSDYNICFNTDRNYVPYLFVVFQSILESLEDAEGNAQDHLSFHVLLDDTVDTNAFQAYIQRFQTLNTSSKLSFNIASYRVNSDTFEACHKMTKDGLTSLAAYYRILFAQVLPVDIPRILYMDIDVLVCEDIRKIFNQYPMDDEVLYACPNAHCFKYAKDPFAEHPVYEYAPLMEGLEPYQLPIEHFIESGVMLINVEQWKKLNIEQQCLESAINWDLTFHDQSAISMACQNKIKPLDATCNFLITYFKYLDNGGTFVGQEIYPFEKMPIKPAPTLADLKELSCHPKIVHFVCFKPWIFNRALTPEEYNEVKGMFPYLLKWLKIYKRIKPIFQS